MVVDSSSLLSKYLGEKEGNSLKFMQRMLYLIFSEVVYQRELLPREHFTEKLILGCKLHIPDTCRDRRQVALHNHLKGAADAVTNKKLKQFHLMVHKDRNDPSAADEVFIMELVYDECEVAMQMSCGDVPDVRVCYEGVEELQKQTRDVFRCLRKGLSSLEPITRNVSFSFYIMYRDGVDRSYHPTGYGQAARMYQLPETAEIGDMGMLHAKEHACLLKVKSMMLEDGFQLMQRNVATQRSEADSLVLSEPSQDSVEKLTSDTATSLGVFDCPSDWEETVGGGGGARGDQRSTKDQRSMGAASPRTIRFEQTPSILDRSMSEDDASEESKELGMAGLDDFPEMTATETADKMTSQPTKKAPPPPPPQPAARLLEGNNTSTSTQKTFASTVSLVTKRLAAADKKRDDEEMEKKRAKTTPLADRSLTSYVDAGSEASDEKPKPVRRVSLRKKKGLAKVPEESTESDETQADRAEESEVPATPKEQRKSSGKDADSEPSGDTGVDKKATVERRRSGRRKGSMEKAATVPDESMAMEQEEMEATPQPKNQRAQRRGKASKETETPKTPVESEDTDVQSSTEKPTGRKSRRPLEDTVSEKVVVERRRSGRRTGSMEKAATVPNESMVMEEEQKEATPRPKKQRALRRGKGAKETETPKTPEDSEDTDDQSSNEKSIGRRKGRISKGTVDSKSIEETPKRGEKSDTKAWVEEIRTPGETNKRKPIYSQQYYSQK